MTARCCWVLLLLLAATRASGAGFALGEQSARAGGTGGASTARDADPAAAWYNPAALANDGGLRLSAGLMAAVPLLNARALDGSWDARTTSGVRTPPHLYLSYARGPLAGGIAVNVPFGSGVAWPADWRGRFEIVSSSLQVFRLAPFAAWRFGRLRVGAGIHLDISTLRIQRRLDFVDKEGEVTLDLRDIGLGGHASIYLDLAPWLSLGASYKSRGALSFAGSAKFEAPPAFAAQAHDQRATASFALPDLIAVGIVGQPHRRVDLILDLGITLWSVVDRLAVDFEDQDTSDSELPYRWEVVASVRGGGEVRVLPWLELRAGLFYEPSPAQGETLAPSSPDSDRLGATAGIGAALRWGLSIDLFYALVHMLGQSSTNSENLRAEYDGTIHLMGLGLRGHFPLK